MADPVIIPRPVFGLSAAGLPAESAGVVVSERIGLALAILAARKGREAELGQRIGERFGVALPPAGRRSAAGEAAVSFVWEGPGRWLAVAEDADGHHWEAVLREVAAGSASVTDQSDGRGVLRLSGPALRMVLAKGIGIDLHPAVFGAGAAASTLLSHVGVQLWVLEDGETIELAAPRSYAGSVLRWLEAAAGETGLSIIG